MPKIIRGFWGKVFKLLIFTVLITGTFILTGIIFSQSTFIEKKLIERKIVLAETISEAIRIGYLNFAWPLEMLKRVSDSEEIVFLWLVKPNGEIFFSDDPKIQRKIISKKFFTEKTYRIIKSNYLDQKIKLLVLPVYLELGEKPWQLFLGVSLKPIDLAKKEILFDGLLILLLIIPFSFLISFYFVKGIVGPLEKLKRGAEIIGKGDFRHRIILKTNDEFEELAKVFNLMTENLSRARSSLEEAQTTLKIRVDAKTHQLKELVEHLEDRIKERTKELEERLKELEKFHRLTVARELKMIELKRKIEKLKTELRKKELEK